MIQYEERVKDVADALRGGFGVEDTEAIDLLLASRVECDIPYPWLILDTQYYRMDTTGAWFQQIFDTVMPMPILRTLRPRLSNTYIQEMLRARDTPRLFIEPHWEIPPTTAYQLKMWPYLLQECIRIRSGYPKRVLPDERSGLLAQAAVKRALDDRWRTVDAKMPHPPPSLPYWCELLQKLSPYPRDWDLLLTNLCALAGRRAYLYNRRVDSTDWDAVGRVMKDTVPAWTAEIVGHFGSRGRIKSLRGKYSRRIIEEEMKRLLENGVLIHHLGEWKIRDFRERGGDFIELLRGPKIS